MANWMYTIDLVKPVSDWQNDKVTPQQLARNCATAIKEVLPAVKYMDRDLGTDLEELVLEFEDLDAMDDISEFEDIMDRLYDWGDTTMKSGWPATKLCWIRTF